MVYIADTLRRVTRCTSGNALRMKRCCRSRCPSMATILLGISAVRLVIGRTRVRCSNETGGCIFYAVRIRYTTFTDPGWNRRMFRRGCWTFAYCFSARSLSRPETFGRVIRHLRLEFTTDEVTNVVELMNRMQFGRPRRAVWKRRYINLQAARTHSPAQRQPAIRQVAIPYRRAPSCIHSADLEPLRYCSTRPIRTVPARHHRRVDLV